MRVISGKYRGKKLFSPQDSLTVRPTTDRVKENLFNIIQRKVGSSEFLDLFAGSGAIGIEAMSRGANVIFCDIDASLVERNLALFKECCPVLHCDCQTALRQLADKEKQFDIIFIDPPYKSQLAKICVDDIISKNLIASDGIIIVESDSEFTCDEEYTSRKYGDIILYFIKLGEK